MFSKDLCRNMGMEWNKLTENSLGFVSLLENSKHSTQNTRAPPTGCAYISTVTFWCKALPSHKAITFVAKALSFIPCIFRTHYLTIWSAPSLQRSAKFFVVEVLQIRGVLVFLRCVQLFYEFHCELTAIYLITRYFVVENNCYLWQLNLRFCKILSTTIVVRQLLWYRSVLAGPIHLNYTCFGCRTQLYQVSS